MTKNLPSLYIILGIIAFIIFILGEWGATLIAGTLMLVMKRIEEQTVIQQAQLQETRQLNALLTQLTKE